MLYTYLPSVTGKLSLVQFGHESAPTNMPSKSPHLTVFTGSA